MEARKLLDALLVAEKLKDTTRHCYTTNGRHESVAEHSWMMTLMAFFMRDEFPEADMDKVIRMCIIHDLGECFTGDIPAFEKNLAHEQTEKNLLYNWVRSLPKEYEVEMRELYEEMTERKSVEAQIYKAIDGLEALIQHNMSDLTTWIPKEFELNLTYADDKVAFSDYLISLRQAVLEDTIKKIDEVKLVHVK
ncbi:HD domain-containing protein [Lacrimispora sp.]|uniref:HD domain-containing protein n=1 Tax=Lacrimispora sp. TaxID=2719234 RepID=UPI00289A1E59|nr:HD domain-containing protein [Lacrimispora sp.]